MSLLLDLDFRCRSSCEKEAFGEGGIEWMVAFKHDLQSRFKPCSDDVSVWLHHQNGKQRSSRTQVGRSELA